MSEKKDLIDFGTVTKDANQMEQISLAHLGMLINKIGFTYGSLIVRDNGNLYEKLLATINKRLPKQ